MQKYLSIFILLLSFQASASTRVFELDYEGKKFYGIALSPIREAPVRLGVSVLSDENGERGLYLEDANDRDSNFTSLELLYSNLRSHPSSLLRHMKPAFQNQLAKAQYPDQVAHAVEAHLFDTFEEWSISQYLRRARFGKDPKVIAEIEKSIRSEFSQNKDGFGWIAIVDAEGNIVATLVVAARTRLAPKLSLESRIGITIPELPFSEAESYARVGGEPLPVKVNPATGMAPLIPAPILTLELKRFIVNPKVEIQMLPLLLFIGERTGMTWAGPKTRFPMLYKGENVPFDMKTHAVAAVAGQYVLESDAKAARVYAQTPFLFPEPQVMGDDHIFTFSRAKFLEMFWRAQNIENGKISGAAFFQKLKMKYNVVSVITRQSVADLRGAFAQSCSEVLGVDPDSL